MILFAMIVRSHDGLPLSASTDVSGQVHADVTQARKHMKVLARQVGALEDRCSLKLDSHFIHFITSLGVSFMALCDPQYPPVLAFSFLGELQREFITQYTPEQITSALRPYTFIEFDSFIQKTRQRYNNPRSLTTKLNLSDLSTEIKLRPPKQLVLDDLASSMNKTPSFLPIASKHTKDDSAPLTSLPWYAIVSSILSILCVVLNLYRGLMLLSESTVEEIDGISPFHGLTMLLESCLGALQVYLLTQAYPWRCHISSWSLLVILLCNYYLSTVKDFWQLMFIVGVAMFITASTVLHRPQRKSWNYLV